jgi:uncharacterized protein with HEPN domain
MQHDPLVCVEDAVMACEFILQFVQDMTAEDFYADSKTKAAVERKIEVIGEALNRIKVIDYNKLAKIDNWREIIGFRNVIAHGYDVVEDSIVWESIVNDIPLLLNQLKSMQDDE